MLYDDSLSHYDAPSAYYDGFPPPIRKKGKMADSAGDNEGTLDVGWDPLRDQLRNPGEHRTGDGEQLGVQRGVGEIEHDAGRLHERDEDVGARARHRRE